jgi:hypothetical protein
MEIVPVPVTRPNVPLLDVQDEAPDPATNANDEVEFELPRVTVFTAAPVAKETVVAAASVDIPNAPVPEFIVNAPFVDVRLRAPLPDLIAVDEVEFVEPIKSVFTAAASG